MANEQTVAQSKRFINSIHAVLNILDTISSLIPEGAYLEIANQFEDFLTVPAYNEIVRLEAR